MFRFSIFLSFFIFFNLLGKFENELESPNHAQITDFLSQYYQYNLSLHYPSESSSKLCFAIQRGFRSFAFQMIDLGENLSQLGIEKIYNDGRLVAEKRFTPLYCAIISNDLEMIRCLLNKGVNVNETALKEYSFNYANSIPEKSSHFTEKSALHVSMSSAIDSKITKFLLESGAIFDKSIFFNGNPSNLIVLSDYLTPETVNSFPVACCLFVENGIEIIEKLHKRGQLNQNQIDHLLMTAIQYRNLKFVKYAISRGAEVNQEGLLASVILSKESKEDVFSILSEIGINPNRPQRNLEGHEKGPFFCIGGFVTPLILAIATHSNVDVELLIKYGADVNLAAIEALVSEGIYTDFSSTAKMTPLYVAVMKKNDIALRLLLDAGAKPEKKHRGMQSAIELAFDLRYGDYANILLNYEAREFC